MSVIPKKETRMKSFAALLLPVLLLSAAQRERVASVTVAPDSLLLDRADIVTVTCLPKSRSQHTLQNACTWKSSDTTTVRVTPSGQSAVLTARRDGKATVTATAGGKSGTAKIWIGTTVGTIPPVVTPPVGCVGTSTTFAPGDSLQAKVDAQPTGTAFTFCPGIYRMQSITPKTGMTFTGDSGVVLTGAKVITTGPWSSDGAGHFYVGGQTQEGAHGNYVCEVNHDGCKYPEQLWVNDSLYEHLTTLGAIGAGTWYFDYAADRIYLPFNPVDSAVETSVTAQAFSGGATGVTIQGLVVERYANKAQVGAIDGGNGWQIIGNEVRNNHGAGITNGGSSLTRGNHIHQNGQIGLKVSGASSVVDTNEIAWNNVAFFGRGSAVELGGTKFVQTTALMVRGNNVHHNHGPGLWTDVNNKSTTYDGNTVEDNDWKGIFHEVSYDAVIKNNAARRNGFKYDPTGARSPCDGAGIQITNSPDVEIFNNTVEDNRAGICAEDTDRPTPAIPSGYGPHHVVNLTVHDNVVKQIDGGRAGGITDSDPNANPYSAAAANVWTNNAYICSAFTRWHWPTAITKLAWLAVPQDVGSSFTGC